MKIAIQDPKSFLYPLEHKAEDKTYGKLFVKCFNTVTYALYDGLLS